MPHEAFISYSQQDKNAADAVVSHLERSGIACWMAPRDILPGASWPDSIVRALGSCRVLVVVFSSHTNASGHVRREIELAVKRGVPVVPVRIEDVTPEGELEFFLSSSHWMDAITPPIEKHISDLARKIRMLVDPEGAAKGVAPVPEPAGGAPDAEPADDGVAVLWPRDNATRLVMLAGGVVALLVMIGGGWAITRTFGVGGGNGGREVLGAGLDIDSRTLADFKEYSALRQSGATEDYLAERGPVRFQAWSRAAEQGHPRAQFLVGIMYSDGIGVAKDDERAMELFKLSADQGDPAGVNAVGWMYDNGKSVPADDELALAYYREAAEMDDSIAMANLGYSYRYGYANLPADLAASVSWYERSAALGHRGAMWSLSRLYLQGGEGLAKDEKAARKWMDRAVANAEPYAVAETVITPLIEKLDAYTQAVADGKSTTRLERDLGRLVKRYEGLGLRSQLGVLGDWRVVQRMTRVGELDEGDPVRGTVEGMTQNLVEQYAASPRIVRSRFFRDYAKATSGVVQAWEKNGEHMRVAEFWIKCYRDLETEGVPQGEYDSIINQQRACIVSLFSVGRRDDAGVYLEQCLAGCEALLRDRPWDWYSKRAYATLCFEAAEIVALLGDPARAQGLLARAWRIHTYSEGRDELMGRYSGRLPMKGESPADAPAADAAYFMGFASSEEQAEFNKTSEVETVGMKRFTIPTDFNGEKSPFNIYLLSGRRGYLELQDQFRWVYEYRNGVVPEDVQDSFRRLHNLAKKNNVDYQALCVYALAEAEKEKAGEDD